MLRSGWGRLVVVAWFLWLAIVWRGISEQHRNWRDEDYLFFAAKGVGAPLGGLVAGLWIRRGFRSGSKASAQAYDLDADKLERVASWVNATGTPPEQIAAAMLVRWMMVEKHDVANEADANWPSLIMAYDAVHGRPTEQKNAVAAINYASAQLAMDPAMNQRFHDWVARGKADVAAAARRRYAPPSKPIEVDFDDDD